MNGDPLDELEEAGAEIKRLREIAPIGWIAVTERLPRMGERVMVAHAADKWIGVGERDIIGSYEYWSDDGEELNQPTHWMPLPEPPEVK